MEEVNVEPKDGTVTEEAPLKGAVPSDFNAQADAFFKSVDEAKPEGSSPSKDATESTDAEKDAGADQLKKASPEGGGNEDEGKDPRDLMFRKGYNEAKAKFEKDFGGISKEDIESFKKVTSTPDFIRASMKAEGYTDEAINKALTDRGFEVQSKGLDDVSLVAKELGLDLTQMDANTKAVIGDVTRIVDVIFKDRISKTLPNALKPIEEQTTRIAQRDGAAQFMSTVKSTLEKEGVLTIEDVAPHLEKFMDENPTATQNDVLNHFNQINHALSIERLKSGKKAIERSESKKGNRPLTKESTGPEIKLPKKTGNFSQDADAVLDALNVQ